MNNIKHLRLLVVTTGVLVALALIYMITAALADPAATAPAETRTVSFFYYNPANDTDATGNIMCTRQGLVGVERTVTADASIADILRLHLAGELTSAERALGITTEFPLSGLELRDASLADGTLTLTFDDPEGKTGGGSCRVAVLWMQIEATALQFPEVSAVRFVPEELFQP